MANSGYNGKYDRQMRPTREGAKQTWAIGAIVNVGFMKGLEVTEIHDCGDYILKSTKGRFYAFQPHLGIWAL